MKKHLAYSLLACSLLTTGTAHAQERSAGNTTEIQMTWSSLTALANAAKARTEIVNSRVDQVVVCGNKGMVYAPGKPGTDTQGCYQPITDPSISNSLTTVNNSISTVNNSLTNTNNSLYYVLYCNRSGYVYNGSGCIAPAGSTPSCYIAESSAQGAYHNSNNSSNGTCPSGTTAVGTGSSSGTLKCLRVVCS